MLVRLADLRGEVDGVGVGGGIVGVRDNWGCQQRGEAKDAEGLDDAFYRSSPKAVTFGVLSRIFPAIQMIG